MALRRSVSLLFSFSFSLDECEYVYCFRIALFGFTLSFASALARARLQCLPHELPAYARNFPTSAGAAAAHRKQRQTFSSNMLSGDTRATLVEQLTRRGNGAITIITEINRRNDESVLRDRFWNYNCKFRCNSVNTSRGEFIPAASECAARQAR